MLVVVVVVVVEEEEEEEEETEATVTNFIRDMSLYPCPMTKQKRFYVPPEWEETLEKLDEILRREGKRTFSDWVREQISIYVRAHEPGNPQQRLDTVMRIGHAYRAESCCVCAKPADYQAFTKEGLSLLYCWECFEKTGRHRTTGYREYKKKKREA